MLLVERWILPRCVGSLADCHIFNSRSFQQTNTQEHVQVLLQRPVVEYANQYYHVAYTYYSLKVYDQALVFFKALLSEQQTNVCGELHEHPRTLSLAHHLCVAGP